MKTMKTRQLEIIGDSIAGSFDETETESGSVLVQLHPGDPSQKQWMRLAESSKGLEFWNNSAEDIYTECDGEPL